MTTDQEIITRINACLNWERQVRGARNDNELARMLDVSPKTLSFWRNGRIPKTTIKLARVLRNCPDQTDVRS